MKFSTVLIAAASLLLLGPGLALAQGAPVPPSKRQALESQQQRLNAEEEKEKSLRKELTSAEKELAQAREALVSLAREMRRNEEEAQRLERRISGLEGEKSELVTRLTSDYGSIGNLLLALQRLKRVPPEALLVRPGAPVDTARSALLLQSTLPALYDRADRVRKDLRRLEALQTELQEDRKGLDAERRTLAGRQQEMDILLSRREKLYAGMQEEYERQQKVVQAIAAESKNLQDLVTKLDADRRRAETRAIARKAVMASPPARIERTEPRGAGGAPKLPVAGLVRVGYGQKDDLGAISKGITIEGQPGGVVTAPLGGTVRFAGAFKRFGELVIIEHAGGYHSLIAGLAKIDTVVGRKVASGEPVGLLSGSDHNGLPSLYYELRFNGEPVNPSRKFDLPG